MKLIVGVLIAGLLGGCSTSPVTEGDAKPVPSVRIYDPSLVTKSPGKEGAATVLFLRDAGLNGSGCTHDIFVNRVKSFSIRPGESIRITLPPGEYFFRLEAKGVLCPTIATYQLAELKAGQEEAYRILLTPDGSLQFSRVK